MFRALLLCLHVCLCEGVGSSGTGLTASCELTGGCWEPTVLSTAELSLQAPVARILMFLLKWLTGESQVLGQPGLHTKTLRLKQQQQQGWRNGLWLKSTG